MRYMISCFHACFIPNPPPPERFQLLSSSSSHGTLPGNTSLPLHPPFHSTNSLTSFISPSHISSGPTPIQPLRFLFAPNPSSLTPYRSSLHSLHAFISPCSQANRLVPILTFFSELHSSSFNSSSGGSTPLNSILLSGHLSALQ